MNDPARRVYSTRRFRIVATLLTLVFLPIVIGSSLLIYQYMRFSVMVEQRLRGVRGSLPVARLRAAARAAAGAGAGPGGAAQGAQRAALRRARERRAGARAVRAPGERGPLLPATGARRRQRAPAGRVRGRQGGCRADQGDPRRVLEAAVRHAGARAGAHHLRLRRGAREAPARALRGAAGPARQGGAGDRGPPLLQPSRPRPHRPDRPGAAQPPVGQRDPLRRQHDHAAALQELLPDPRGRARLSRRRAQLHAQGPGGAAGVRAGAAGDQAGDPRALPQRDLPRPVGLLRHQRRRRGGADVLPQGRRQPDAAGVRAARRA